MADEFPDISDILARKAEGRRELAKLDFWEKVRRMEALRERVRFLKEAREADRAARGGLPNESAITD